MFISLLRADQGGLSFERLQYLHSACLVARSSMISIATYVMHMSNGHFRVRVAFAG